MMRATVRTALCIAVLSFPKTSPLSAYEKNEAKAFFQEGIELFKNEEYGSALEVFERSYLENPNPNTLFNIAMCQKALFQYAASIRSFEELLTFKSIPEENRETARNAIVEMNEMIGHLAVRCTPDRASVSIDGKVRGECPFDEPLPIDPGKHLITVSLEGHVSIAREIAVKGKDRIVFNAQLKPSAEGSPNDASRSPNKPTDAATPSFLYNDSPDGDAASEKAGKAKLVAGIAATAVGVAGIGAGAYFAIRAVRHEKDYQDAETDDERSRANTALRKDQAGILSGLIAGGIVTAAGLALIAAHRIKMKKKQRKNYAPIVGEAGVGIRF